MLKRITRRSVHLQCDIVHNFILYKVLRRGYSANLRPQERFFARDNGETAKGEFCARHIDCQRYSNGGKSHTAAPATVTCSCAAYAIQIKHLKVKATGNSRFRRVSPLFFTKNPRSRTHKRTFCVYIYV